MPNLSSISCYCRPVFSIGLEVDVQSWDVDVPEAKCQQHFAKTWTLPELKYALQ